MFFIGLAISICRLRSGPYISATRVLSTGGPGGISAIFILAPYLRPICLDPGPHPFGDLMALGASFVLAHEIDLDVNDIASRAQEIMAHETVEIIRGRSPDVGLIIRHLGTVFRYSPISLRERRGFFQR